MIMHWVSMSQKNYSSAANIIDITSLRNIRAEYFVQAIFAFFCAALLSIAVVHLIRQALRKRCDKSQVVFSMMKDSIHWYRTSMIGFLLILSCLALFFFIRQAVMYILLQIDILQGLSVDQVTGTANFTNNTLLGRVLSLNQSIFFDRLDLFRDVTMRMARISIVYLRHSHIIVQIAQLS